MKPIELKLRTAESEAAYCYRTEEVKAMLEYGRQTDALQWLVNVIIALACTGLRIAELASLRWSDIDFDAERLTLTDETGRPAKANQNRRELKSGRSRSFPIHPAFLALLRILTRHDNVYLSRTAWRTTEARYGAKNSRPRSHRAAGMPVPDRGRCEGIHARTVA
jgi:integrase